MCKSWFLILLLAGFALTVRCGRINKYDVAGREPVTEPDLSGVTIPANIAPMNFTIREEGTAFSLNVISSNGENLKIKNSDGRIKFSTRSWKKLLQNNTGGNIRFEIISTGKDGKSVSFESVKMNIADSADQFLCYRLLYPGYETYYDIKIIQRDISSFREWPVVENRLINHNCVNCHSFSNNSPEKFMIHARGNLGGTYFINGDNITKTEFRSDSLPSGAVYPSWHPSGKFIVFSSNSIHQSFHASTAENIEVTDLNSSLVLYDTDENSLTPVHENDTVRYMDTFPEWSPDGKFLYFCRAAQYKDGDDLSSIHYNLLRKAFSAESRTFGNAEIVYDAGQNGKSVSFPRVSPNGRYLVFTLHDHGNFSIWHKDADLYLLDLESKSSVRLDLNSDETESWHCWSSNSKWLIFSSKRDDGLTARPYFAYIGSPELQGKPFPLPQRDPRLYKRLTTTFNRPEFVTGRIKTGPREFAKAAEKTIVVKPAWRSIN